MERNECVQLAEDLVDAFNAHDVDRVSRLLSETVLVVSPEGPVGPYGWKARTADHFKAFPDSLWTKVQVSAKGEEFYLEVLWTGTQQIPPSHRAFRFPATLNGVVKRHKIETLRLDYDQELIRSQLGLAAPSIPESTSRAPEGRRPGSRGPSRSEPAPSPRAVHEPEREPDRR